MLHVLVEMANCEMRHSTGGKLEGNTDLFPNQFMDDWELHLENEVTSSYFTGMVQLEVSTWILCCLSPVLNLSCRYEILVWRSSQFLQVSANS